MNEEELHLPAPESWWRETILKVKNGEIVKKMTVYQCMKVVGPATSVSWYMNPWIKHSMFSRARSKPTAEIGSYTILLRKRVIGKYGYRWKNVVINSQDWPVFNNSEITGLNPISVVVFKPEPKPPKWYKPDSRSGL